MADESRPAAARRLKFPAAAEYLGVSVDTLESLWKKGLIQVHRIGTMRMVEVAELERYWRCCVVRPAGETPAAPAEGTALVSRREKLVRAVGWSGKDHLPRTRRPRKPRAGG